MEDNYDLIEKVDYLEELHIDDDKGSWRDVICGVGWFVWGVVGISNLHYIGHNSVKNKGSIPLQVFFSWCVYYEKSCSSKLHYLTTKILKITHIQLLCNYPPKYMMY